MSVYTNQIEADEAVNSVLSKINEKDNNVSNLVKLNTGAIGYVVDFETVTRDELVNEVNICKEALEAAQAKVKEFDSLSDTTAETVTPETPVNEPVEVTNAVVNGQDVPVNNDGTVTVETPQATVTLDVTPEVAPTPQAPVQAAPVEQPQPIVIQ